ncbi:MAG: phosphodiester glycosidase family protein [Lachnospiraceae bacterium]|nr:phosphodiester glycosidase family protein [Lachnospiraceae bacterium]
MSWKEKRKRQIRRRVAAFFCLPLSLLLMVLLGRGMKNRVSAEDSATKLEPAQEPTLSVQEAGDDYYRFTPEELEEAREEQEAEETEAEKELPVPTQAPVRPHQDWLVDVSDEYDKTLGNYEVISISGFHPYVFAPDGAGSGVIRDVSSVTRLVEDYGEGQHVAVALNAGIFYDSLASKVYCFGGKQADGILIAGGTVLKSVETVDHTECEPLVIDEDGNVGWTDFYADADALARGNGYYYDIHGNKVTGKKIVSAVTGFVPILVNGKNLYDASAAPLYGYGNYVNHYFGRWGRQVFGVREDGSFVILTVTTKSWTLKNAADAALKHGCVFAYNLDGGNSIETVVSDFTGGERRIETLNKVNWGNQIPACIVFTDDSIAPVSAVPEEITVTAPEESIPAGTSWAGIAERLVVEERFTNANGHDSKRRVYSYLSALQEPVERAVMCVSGTKKKQTMISGGNLAYTKTKGEAWGNLRMNDNTRYDGKYYDFGTGFTLESEDDLTTPGKKTVTVSYNPGGGWRDLTTEVSFTME